MPFKGPIRKKTSGTKKLTEPTSSVVNGQRPFGDGPQEGKGSLTLDVAVTDASSVKIVGQCTIDSLACLVDGEHLIGGNREGKIQQWQVVDGKETENAMVTESPVTSLAVSADGKWLVSGTERGLVTVWATESHENTAEFDAGNEAVQAVDVSPEGKRIASTSRDQAVIWSLSTRLRLLSLKHDTEVVAVKFSPDGKLVATRDRNTVLVHDSRNGRLFADARVGVELARNGSLAWASDSEQLYLSSFDGTIHCFDVASRRTLAKWSIHGDGEPRYITLACNDTVIATSARSSLSFWDTRTHQPIGTVISYSDSISCMTISPTGDIATVHQNIIRLRNICSILPLPYSNDLRQAFLKQEICRLKIEKEGLEDVVHSLRAQNESSNRKITHLDESLQELRCTKIEKEGLEDTVRSLRAQNESSNRKITHRDESLQELRCAMSKSQSIISQLTALVSQEMSPVTAQTTTCLKQTMRELSDYFVSCQGIICLLDKKYACEEARANDRIYDAAQLLMEIMNTTAESPKYNPRISDWLMEFTACCISKLHSIGDEALSSKKTKEALSAYSTVLLLTPSPPKAVLMGWARNILKGCSFNESLSTTDKFKLSRFHLYRALCEVLEAFDRVTEATDCFWSMKSELSQRASTDSEQLLWEQDFRQRCIEKLEKAGDKAMRPKSHNVATGSYSSALSLDPENISIIVKCCKARVGFLEDELIDAIGDIEQNSSCYKGYKRKHAVLHSMGCYKEAFGAFEMMLSRMDKSPDQQIRRMRCGYLDSTSKIRKAIKLTICDTPRVLIDTTTGRLCDEKSRAAAFEQSAIFNELRSSMITYNRLDYVRIKSEVEKFYDYVMFSHRWQPPEPSFQTVEDISIYHLPTSPANNKLFNFCKLVRSRRFRWAWSDTCCVNQADPRIQQESIMAMFRWYRRATLTIVHLLGVPSNSQEPGCLWKSIWNTRGWTFQEYVASGVIQFYTEDWQPYLGLKMFNHKESPIILEEMEQATKFTTLALATLQPGLSRVREKLYLASKRETTWEEDVAYSLFGVFDVTLPVVYGEGKRAVCRLLEHILTRSDNVTLLSWTGNSGNSTTSYLPATFTVFDKIDPPHVPKPIDCTEMDRMVTGLQPSLPDLSLPTQLYNRLHNLSPLSIVAARLRLPGLVFSLTSLSLLGTFDFASDTIVHTYRATAHVLGDIQIETKDDLIGMHGLVLIHPWIGPLLDRDFSGGAPQFDKAMRALRLVVRLRQPFGALLLASQGRLHYKRVAADSFIRAQITAETPLEELMDSIRTVDIQ